MRSRIIQETLMDSIAVGLSSTVYSKSVKFRLCTGSAAMIIISTAGSITVTQQCSADNITWYDPIDSTGGAIGIVKISQTLTTGIYVAFNPAMAEYIRFKIIEGGTAATVVTLKMLQREEA